MLENLLISPGENYGISKGNSQIHRGRYYVALRRSGEDIKRDLSVSIERNYQADSLKIVVWDEEEPTFLCVIRITRTDYEELKKQQGLLIDFDNFPAQLVRLLQQCAANNMFLILQQADPRQYFLEVVEHNEFKRLVHLSLRTTPATDADVRAHMTVMISALKKSLTTAKNAATSGDLAWNEKCSNLEKKIKEMSVSLARMEEDRERREIEHHEQIRLERDRHNKERSEWRQNAELTTKAHETALREAECRAQKQIEELNVKCKQLRENIGKLEAQMCEKMNRMNVLEKELQKSHIEVATLTTKHSASERENAEKDRQIKYAQNKYNDLEKILKDANEQIKEMSGNVQSLQREKLNLEQKLSLSESLVNRNNQAVQTTSEQLIKANQIISKLNVDLVEIKEKLICRTAIVLEQEKEIERSVKEIESLKRREEDLTRECSQLKSERDEATNKLEALEKSMKEKDETLKNNTMVIQWLHKKMEELNPTSDRPWETLRPETANTRTTLSNLNLSDPLEDRTEEDGPTSRRSRSGKSLDPRYLRPVDDDKAKSARGKENITTNLPKVDYNPKKSARVKVTSAAAFHPT